MNWGAELTNFNHHEQVKNLSNCSEYQLFCQYFNTSPYMGLLISEQGEILHPNRSLCSYLGYSENELRSQHLIKIAPNVNPANFQRSLNDLYLEKILFKCGLTKKKNGSSFLSEVRMTELKFDNHPIFLAYIKDITAREQSATSILNEHLILLKSIFDFLPVLLILMDRKKQIIYVNKTTRKKLGWDEAILQKYMDGIAKDEKIGDQKSWEMLTHIYDKKKYWKKFSVKDVDGHPLILEWASTLLPDDTAFISIANDLTLYESYEELIQKNILSKQFWADVNHEIRTPLMVISGAGEMISKEAIGQKQKELSDMLKRSSDHLVCLLNNALQSTNGYLDSEKNCKSTFKINDVVDCVISLSKILASKNHNRTILDGAISDDLCVIGDSSILQQILLNLVINAHKFTRNGEVIIGIKSEKLTSEMINFVATVKDNGIGIEPDDQVKVFDSYFQVDSEYSQANDGSGLGLSIVKKLLNSLNGVIDLQSAPGKGSTFTITIPYTIRQK